MRLGGIAGFIVRRLLLGLLVLGLVSLVVFAATQALPCDPARSILGRTATPASLKALRDQLGLGGSVVSQYFSWVGGLLHGDAGNSLAAQEPVQPRLNNVPARGFRSARPHGAGARRERRRRQPRHKTRRQLNRANLSTASVRI